MQLAMRVVDAVAATQGIEAVALARVHLARERERVDHAAQRAVTRRVSPCSRFELHVEERDVERRVVNDQLRAVDEREQLLRDLVKARLAQQEFAARCRAP